MDADRRERAKSIRAARDWLTGAEVALAGEDDLAGDLKLMLARAELARLAADRRARVRRWVGRLLPPIAAAVAILAWMMWMSHPAEEVAVSPVVPAAVEQTLSPSAEAGPPPVVERADAAATLPEEPTLQQESMQQIPAENPMREDTEVPTVGTVPTRTEAAVSAPSVQPRMPNADMQRLMQVGGKILRE